MNFHQCKQQRQQHFLVSAIASSAARQVAYYVERHSTRDCDEYELQQREEELQRQAANIIGNA